MARRVGALLGRGGHGWVRQCWAGRGVSSSGLAVMSWRGVFRRGWSRSGLAWRSSLGDSFRVGVGNGESGRSWFGSVSPGEAGQE